MTYMPSAEEIMHAWLHSSQSDPNRRVAWQDAARGLAKIKADALREAAEKVSLLVVGVEPGDDLDSLATAAAQGWLTGYANRIEREAGI